MREIKFRAWGPNSKYMWPWEELIANDISMRWIQPSYREKILMQYTGLKDKNGVDIYEGDLDQRGRTVVYLPKEAGFWLEKKIDKNTKQKDRLSSFVSYKLEVIGNIYENPELL